ncbi:DUF4136 domain-containing protein [Vibrio hippocampi]|uniref:DUF4136 domain-containing protein n=1 Tax=Vibrio hippocampi TaxID=654686 RepID=A0ABM8ZK30_9VIBR|nr:DUF4136 domain-containing protein [Vibrio hippocampi]CAH0527290.1 hypothetical protein VHP8226_02619 [Vibrio hippocampi]
MYKALISAVVSLFLVAGCASDVATDFNADVDFSSYTQYQYKEDPDTPISLDAARIKSAVDQQLAQKGLKKVDADANMLVYYSIIEASELLADGPSFTFGVGSGRYRGAGYGVGVSTPERIKERKYGKINVELIDAKTNQVIWRSISQRQLTESMSPQDREAFINDQVAKMFVEYGN